jgi:hypothetical protein
MSIGLLLFCEQIVRKMTCDQWGNTVVGLPPLCHSSSSSLRTQS